MPGRVGHGIATAISGHRDGVVAMVASVNKKLQHRDMPGLCCEQRWPRTTLVFQVGVRARIEK